MLDTVVGENIAPVLTSQATMLYDGQHHPLRKMALTHPPLRVMAQPHPLREAALTHGPPVVAHPQLALLTKYSQKKTVVSVLSVTKRGGIIT